jgi:hypothetical protein
MNKFIARLKVSVNKYTSKIINNGPKRRCGIPRASRPASTAPGATCPLLIILDTYVSITTPPGPRAICLSSKKCNFADFLPIANAFRALGWHNLNATSVSQTFVLTLPVPRSASSRCCAQLLKTGAAVFSVSALIVSLRRIKRFFQKFLHTFRNPLFPNGIAPEVCRG